MSSTEESLPEQTNESSLKEYEQHTYEELSQEFNELYPAAARAFELVPQMYNRLTLVDGFTHREAVAKIHNDHNHLAGFTQRNIRRYLPGDNPNIPRRVRTSRPKNSITETAENPNNEQEVYATGIDFEFSLPFEEVRRYMELIFRENKGVSRLYFHGRLDVQTGKVTSVFPGTESNNSSSDKAIAGESDSGQDDTSNDSDTYQW
jgi:hypothetical protein